MCGIAGIVGKRDPATDAHTIEQMMAVLRHRGPDDSGSWTHDEISLVHTRLSIIDLSGSQQPMATADGRWHLVFNGEIFNYRQLRNELNYPFRTGGDTEVLLAGIAQHGIGFVSRLVGQFSFAAHDGRSRTTHLVRDRLGILPLYYVHTPRGLIFASEVKALFPALTRAPGVDMASLDAYLAHRSVPSPHTLFEGVKKLRPGHRLEVTADGQFTQHRYWTLPSPDPRGDWTPHDAVEAVDVAVRHAVESAMVADVPIGAYLSGGVDSSLIVAVMSHLRGNGQGIETFAAGFGDERHDELPWARRVSSLFGTEHHEVDVRAGDFETLWGRLTWHRDAPLSEPADVAVFRLAELARKRVKVVLSGEGSDELFAGYPKHRFATALQWGDRVPKGVRSWFGQALDHRLPAGAARARIALRAATAVSEQDRFRAWFAPFTPVERGELLGSLARRDLNEGLRLPPGDAIGRMLATDVTAWLPDNLLERGDRMSMAASLELRPPLLDHRLVELAFRLPSSVKVRRGTSKWVLKEVARRYLPSDVVDRRKVGFRVPLDRWFRGGLRESAFDRLTGADSFVANTLDKNAVRAILSRHDSGHFNEEARIWTLMCLEMWHETFFRNPILDRDLSR